MPFTIKASCDRIADQIRLTVSQESQVVVLTLTCVDALDLATTILDTYQQQIGMFGIGHCHNPEVRFEGDMVTATMKKGPSYDGQLKLPLAPAAPLHVPPQSPPLLTIVK